MENRKTRNTTSDTLSKKQLAGVIAIHPLEGPDIIPQSTIHYLAQRQAVAHQEYYELSRQLADLRMRLANGAVCEKGDYYFDSQKGLVRSRRKAGGA